VQGLTNPVCDVSVVGNTVASTKYAGFIVPGEDCATTADENTFYNNIAHSNQVGAVVYPKH